MINVRRNHKNPILSPDYNHNWEEKAAFNPSVIKDKKIYHMVYRALSGNEKINNHTLEVSRIGYTNSNDGVNFTNRSILISPSEDFDRYGCEDPRITKWGDEYYIFYTAIGGFPPGPDNIKVAVCKTKDFKTIYDKKLVTPFNAKACGMFPELINGKIALIMSVNTDKPPSQISIAFLDSIEEITNKKYWDAWYTNLVHHSLPLYHTTKDQLEVGAVPIKTNDGWLLIYCHIQNYFGNPTIFRIDAALLDLVNPLIVRGQTTEPILVPELEYELRGMVSNVIFPSGAVINEDKLNIYYGATDTFSALAEVSMKELIEDIRPTGLGNITVFPRHIEFIRANNNPIISPRPQIEWETHYTLNPGALKIDDTIYIFYRAQGNNGTSVLGLATSKDGTTIQTRLDKPVYVPREYFETKAMGAGFSGCEDPRMTFIDNTCYMTYTAYDGVNPPRVAYTTIDKRDLAKMKFAWHIPKLLSPPGIDDKNACILPEKINGKYVIFHRLNPHIWVDYVDSLDFIPHMWLGGRVVLEPRMNRWDSEKVGIGPPPIKTEIGWILIYHAISKYDRRYRLGVALLDKHDLTKVLVRLPYPVLEPKERYEMDGLRPGTVFACGQALLGEQLFIYYGGADQYTCAASLNINDLIGELKNHI